MNRSMSRGRRQGNRGITNRGMDVASSPGMGYNDRFGTSLSGPLATEHHKLHDLDLELALLKRKRQLIEEQQQMLSTGDQFGRPSPYGYDQPKSYNQQYDDPRQSMSTQSFAHYYDSPGPQFDRLDRKRQAGDSGWQNSSAPKRFGGPQRDPPKQSGGRPGQYPTPFGGGGGGAFNKQTPRSQNYQRSDAGSGKPHMGTSWPKPNTPSRGRKFNPTKVTKPKPNSAPNKLDSYPIAERKNLVSKASSLAKTSTEQDIILHADKPPSRKMLGRMELALGAIFRDIKLLHGDTAPALSPSSLRIIKQAIRDRVRSVMLGKPVSTAADVIKIYREKYPMETNKEILTLGLQAEQSKPTHKLAIRLIETGNPDKFFKTNFSRLVSHQLDEMFSNLHDIYKNEKDNGKSVQEIMDAILMEEGSRLESVFNLKESTDTKVTDKSAESKLTDESQTGTIEDSSTEVKQADSQAEVIDDNSAVVEPADESQAEMTAESETPITDESSTANKPAAENGDNPKVGDEVAETIPENKGNDEEMNATGIDCGDDNDLSIVDMSQNDGGNDNSITDAAKKQAVKQLRASFYTRLMDVLIKRRLPYILPKYKDMIMKKILNSDETYKTTLAHVIIGTNKRASDLEANNQEKKVAGINSEQKNQDKPAPRMLPYFVKIFGHPALPKRKLMQAFLDQFHPASIKKHRGVHNLLFVGLADKEDFDNILAANQTVIGNCRLDIKVSEKVNKPEEAKKVRKIVESDDTVIELKDDAPVKTEEYSDIKLDAELDDQINDLLTTIREEEERNEAEEAKNTEHMQSVAESESQNKPEKLVQENGGNDAEETAEASSAKPSPTEATSVTRATATRVATPAKAPSVATPPANSVRTRRASRLEKEN